MNLNIKLPPNNHIQRPVVKIREQSMDHAYLNLKINFEIKNAWHTWKKYSKLFKNFKRKGEKLNPSERHAHHSV